MPDVLSPYGLGFLRTELETGLTLARIARTAKQADKRNRNLLNQKSVRSRAALYAWSCPHDSPVERIEEHAGAAKEGASDSGRKRSV